MRRLRPREGKQLSIMWLVQFSSVAQLCPTLCDPINCSTPGLPVHHQLPEFTPTHIHRVSDAIQPSHPLSSPFPPAPNSSQHQGLSNESTLCMRWPKYWTFSFSIVPSNEHLSARQYLNPCSLIPWFIFFKSLCPTALKSMDLSTCYNISKLQSNH